MTRGNILDLVCNLSLGNSDEGGQAPQPINCNRVNLCELFMVALS